MDIKKIHKAGMQLLRNHLCDKITLKDKDGNIYRNIPCVISEVRIEEQDRNNSVYLNRSMMVFKVAMEDLEMANAPVKNYETITYNRKTFSVNKENFNGSFATILELTASVVE